ncbi:adenosylcobinamide-phosphate synthase CbiB [Aureimonas psammosilenae]|uniref:adenosylcobinamide-phosphate synthase CbiB n=1 Tax=Aureimonas psammosilenae TaxID=2495496 RepID=UPI0012606BF7|nr:adenosylcobinamide-phosphate synthase CbiB [Aureimonas psammosilenae]
MIVHLFTLLLGTLVDRLVGDPPWAWRRVPHPVVLIGRAIDWMDKRWNDPRLRSSARRWRGVGAILLLLFLAVLVGYDLHWLLMAIGPVGVLVEALIVAVLLAQKSLSVHVSDVGKALREGGLRQGRVAVSRIVGRDPEGLSESGVCRAAVESLAENASDGVVAPWLFYLAFGLPGIFAYKVLNTADSMIGHMSERHRAFGWASARLDDLANIVPARLTALAFALLAPFAGGRFRDAIRVAWRDARLHRSPNAGWPEAAMAGALGLALGGPRRYGEVVVDAPELHPEGRGDAVPEDIDAALVLLRRLSDLLIAALVLFTLGSLI